MQYELAKELKDAGFPMDYELENFTEFDKQGNWINIDLSELIEACGGKMDRLENLVKNEWEAGEIDYGCEGDTWFCLSGKGTTPEESVARFWLALNKK